LRLAVISPFLDRRHGTERVIIEQLERFSANPDVEIHIYAQNVEDLSGVSRAAPSSKGEAPARIIWHRIPRFPGPHVFAYTWWFFANQIYRWRDARFLGLTYDLVYSPGINAFDADAIGVHIVFHEFYRRLGSRLDLMGSRVPGWPRRIHRRLYYKLIMGLERRIYTRRTTSLAAVSQLVSCHLAEFFHRSDVHVVPNAVDTVQFTPEVRLSRRKAAREQLRLSPDVFALLLVGNDWEKKGLGTVLRSMGECRDLPIELLVVGQDDQSIFLPLIQQLGLERRVRFQPSSSDVVQFYAAADLYVSPSLEDSFALPPLEAMACGLPVITSINNGGSQIVTDSVDGFVLKDPCDVVALTGLVRELCEHAELCRAIGQRAARTAYAYDWERNARETWAFLMSALEKKRSAKAPRLKANVNFPE
jgi:glycosyltransferase involved in cell wall biosynthesis